MNAPFPREPMGLIRAVAGQAVATEFLVTPLPLWPVRGVFLTGRLPGVPPALPLRRLFLASLVLGVLRWWTGSLGVLWSLAVVLADWPGLPGAGALLGASLLGGLLGRSSEEERARREILGLAAGVNALPAWLAAPAARRVFAVLRSDWAMTQPGPDQDGERVDWHEAAARSAEVDELLLPLLFALAAYEARLEPGPEAEALREQVWTNVQRRWEPRFLGGAAPCPGLA